MLSRIFLGFPVLLLWMAVVTSPLEPTHASSPLQPTHASSPLEPTHASSPLQPTHASSPLEATHASSPLQPTHASSPLEATHASSPLEATHASSPLQPTHASSPLEPSHASSPLEATHASSPLQPTHASSPLEPTHASSPLELNPPRVVVRYGDSVSVNCSTSSTDLEGMGWEATLGGVSFKPVNIVTWTVDNLTDWTIEPTCFKTLTNGEQKLRVLPVILYKTPDSVSISPLSHSGPMVEGTEYQLQCDIQNVAPLRNLVVKWYKGDEPLDIVTYSNVSKTPEDVSATLMITPSRDDDGAQYRCVAELDLGPDGPQHHPTVTSEHLNITVHYKPLINASRLPGRIPVFRGYPEELVCEAEGYPQPRIQWLYDQAKHVSEEGGNLTVFEAGLYNCTATNDVETRFIVVEVVLKEDYLPLIAGVVAVTVVVISVIFVFIYYIYYKNTKIGRYSLMNAKLSSTANANVAQNGGRDIPLPMTKLSEPNIYF